MLSSGNIKKVEALTRKAWKKGARAGNVNDWVVGQLPRQFVDSNFSEIDVLIDETKYAILDREVAQ